MTDPLGRLVTDPALAGEAAAVRAEWRAEEEEWTRAEAERWMHRRTLTDLAREYLHRGDTVAVVGAGTSFYGKLTRVGLDWLQVQTSSGPVDVGLSPHTPVVIQRVARAAAGGCRDDGAVATFRARLLEHEAYGEDVVVGSTLLADTLQGALTVGADHVVVTAGEIETALASVSWVRPARDPF